MQKECGATDSYRILVFHITYSPSSTTVGAVSYPVFISHIPYPLRFTSFSCVARDYITPEFYAVGGLAHTQYSYSIFHIAFRSAVVCGPRRLGERSPRPLPGAPLKVQSRAGACLRPFPLHLRDLLLGCISDNPVSTLRRCGGGGSATTAAALPQHPPARGLAALLLKVRAPPQTRAPHVHAHALTLTYSLTYLPTHTPIHPLTRVLARGHRARAGAPLGGSAAALRRRLSSARLGSALATRRVGRRRLD